MSPAAPPRRSRRGQQRAYRVGDIVEILRDGDFTLGRLITKTQKKDGDHCPVDHWLVAFEAEGDEKEITDRYLGKLVENYSKAAAAEKKTIAARKTQTTTRKSVLVVAGKSPSPIPIAVNKENLSSALSSSSSASSASSTRLFDKPKIMATRTRSQRNHAVPTDILQHKMMTTTTSTAAQPRKEKEPVIKVKMLTGVLYLYRGLNRRAEFVRCV